MKKKALVTRMAAFAMAGAMTMAMGFPALADTTEAKKPVSLHKKVTTDGRTFAPNATFNFTVTPTTQYGSNPTAADQAGTGLDQDGITDGLTLDQSGNITFTANVADAVSALYEKELAFNIDSTKFTKPGRYHYFVEETNDELKYDGIVFDKNIKEVIVFVYKDDAGELKYVLTNNDLDNPDKHAQIEFINEYGVGAAENKVQKLEVKKEIAGNFSSLLDEFEVTIKIERNREEGDNARKIYVAEKKHGEDITTINITEGASSAIKINGNDIITIYGLTTKDTVNVEETDSKGYDIMYKSEGSVAPTVVNGDKPFEGTTNAFTGTIVDTDDLDDATLVITNTKNTAATPTGIVTEYAPYILLVAAAGTFAVLFLRKRKEEF